MKRFKAAAVQIAPDLTYGTGSFDAGSTDSHHVFPAEQPRNRFDARLPGAGDRFDCRFSCLIKMNVRSGG
jgi:hypothetical protein